MAATGIRSFSGNDPEYPVRWNPHAMGRRRRTREEEDFQMAPMIDMVFLLLVFFMTVSTMARESRPEMPLPLSSEAVVPTEAPPRDILSLLSGDRGEILFLNNREVALEELPGAFRFGESGGDPVQLVIRAVPKTTWRRLGPLLERLRQIPAMQITLATHED